MSTIYTGVPASWYTPGIYINVDLGREEPSAAGIARRVLLLGNKLDDVGTFRKEVPAWTDIDSTDVQTWIGLNSEYQIETESTFETNGTNAENWARNQYLIAYPDYYKLCLEADPQVDPLSKENYQTSTGYISINSDDVRDYDTYKKEADQRALTAYTFDQLPLSLVEQPLGLAGFIANDAVNQKYCNNNEQVNRAAFAVYLDTSPVDPYLFEVFVAEANAEDPAGPLMTLIHEAGHKVYVDESKKSQVDSVLDNLLPKGVFGDSDTGITAGESSYYAIPDLRTAAVLFGYGSELYVMAKAAFKADRNVNLWGYVQTEASGDRAKTIGVKDGNTTASSPPDWMGFSSPTEDGAITVSCQNQSCSVQVSTADTSQDIAFKVARKFNDALKDLPVYCEIRTDWGTDTDGNLEITDVHDDVRFVAKHPGAVWNKYGNKAQSVIIDVSACDSIVLTDEDATPIEPDDTDGSVYTFTFKEVDETLVPDTGSCAFSDTSPLLAERFHYIVSPYRDNTNVGELRDFLQAQSDPVNGLRQQGVVATNGNLDAANSIITNTNHPRVQCIWATNNNYYPGQLGAAVTAVRAKWEGSDPAVNLCNKPVAGVPSTDDVDLPTVAEKNDAIGKGVTPLIPYQGDMVILRSVTTAAANQLTPVLDTGKVTVSDYVADDIQLKMTTRYKGFKLSPDTSSPLPSRVTTPSRIQTALIEWLRNLESQGIITRVGELQDQVLVELDETVAGRINFEIPEDVVDIFAVGAGNIIQIG